MKSSRKAIVTTKVQLNTTSCKVGQRIICLYGLKKYLPAYPDPEAEAIGAFSDGEPRPSFSRPRLATQLVEASPTYSGAGIVLRGAGFSLSNELVQKRSQLFVHLRFPPWEGVEERKSQVHSPSFVKFLSPSFQTEKEFFSARKNFSKLSELKRER